MNRRGFTFVELLMVFTVIGILVAIAVPTLQDTRLKAMAASVIGDFHAIRTAAYDQFADNGTYPPTDAWGVVPADFVPSLPGGFAFQTDDAEYRWRRWALPNGLPPGGGGGPSTLLAVQVRSANEMLMEQIQKLWNGPQFGDETELTLVIE